MPTYTWRCSNCGDTNPPHTETCRSCEVSAPSDAAQVRTKRRTFGNWLTGVGLTIMLGPIAIFFFMATFPSLFSSNTVLLWHYLSAFGLIVYVPVGLIIIAIGVVVRG